MRPRPHPPLPPPIWNPPCRAGCLPAFKYTSTLCIPEAVEIVKTCVEKGGYAPGVRRELAKRKVTCLPQNAMDALTLVQWNSASCWKDYGRAIADAVKAKDWEGVHRAIIDCNAAIKAKSQGKYDAPANETRAMARSLLLGEYTPAEPFVPPQPLVSWRCQVRNVVPC